METMYFSLFCRSGGEAERESDKIKSCPMPERGFPKENAPDSTGYMCSVQIKGSLVKAH